MRKKDKIFLVLLWIWFFLSAYFLNGAAQKASYILLFISALVYAVSLRK